MGDRPAAKHRADDEECAICDAPPPYEFELLAELDRMHTMVGLIKVLHTVGDYGTCVCCGWLFPCQTVQYIRDAEVDHGS